MIHLVTFASDDYTVSARACIESAERMGVNAHALFTPGNIRHWEFTADTVKDNASLFDAFRGCGFWAFKPLILDAYMRGCSDGDICLYADAGLEFIEPVQTVINLMDQDIWLFGNEHLHAHWCKRDIVEEVWARPVLDQPYYDYSAHRGGVSALDDDGELSWENFGKQVQASVIFFRVNDYTRAFVKEWLDWCLFEGGRLIDDSPSRLPNHPEFKENRHDQAILTTMAYREGIKLHEWFVKYEGYTPGRMSGYPRELERPFVYHHRRRNSEWQGIAA